MTRIAIVTDSTANLPPTSVDFWRIHVVPVHVIVDDRTFSEGVDITPSELAADLRADKRVSTSRPTPALFSELYQGLADSGAEHIVSAHLSAELSGTHDAALIAARSSPVPVTVVDSRSISMGLGFGVLEGARVAARGEGPEVVAEAVRQISTTARVLFYVDTLEYLRRGGRIGSAQRIIGGALAVKPILHVAKGRVQPLEKVRTTSRAMGRLEDLTADTAGQHKVSVAVMHLDAKDRADKLAASLRHRLPDADIIVGEVGAVIGCHVGPGMVASIVSPVL